MKSQQIKNFRNLDVVFLNTILKQKANLFRRVSLSFAMAPHRADQVQKMRKICNVLRLNAVGSFSSSSSVFDRHH